MNNKGPIIDNKRLRLILKPQQITFEYKSVPEFNGSLPIHDYEIYFASSTELTKYLHHENSLHINSN